MFPPLYRHRIPSNVNSPSDAVISSPINFFTDQLLQDIFPAEEVRQFWRRCCCAQTTAAAAITSQRDSGATSIGAASLCGAAFGANDAASEMSVRLVVSLDVLVDELEKYVVFKSFIW